MPEPASLLLALCAFAGVGRRQATLR
ncbi:hypothetical protein [Pseudobythopirellula maris]